MPDRYSIDALLNSGIQPLPDWSDDEREHYGKGIKRSRQMMAPVLLTEDGILFDGHQRLKTLRSKGAKDIPASDVRIVEGATKANALEHALRANVQRRQLTVEQKAELARYLMNTRGWSQGKIAKEIGVSRPAVSQWLAKYPGDDDEAPEFVVGLDGKMRDVAGSPRQPEDEAPSRNPWRSDGANYRAVRKAMRVAQDPHGIDGLSPLQLAQLGQQVSDALEALQELSDRIEEAS